MVVFFLNSYNAKLTNEKMRKFLTISQSTEKILFTAKEAINLLEGRSVKIEFHNPKSDQAGNRFCPVQFDEPKQKRKLFVPKFL